MSTRSLRFLLICFCCCGILSCRSSQENSQSRQPQANSTKKVRIDDVERYATNLPTPEYPLESLRDRVEGLAVIQADVSSDGRVRDAKVLQAPNTEIGYSALRAARATVFQLPEISGNYSPEGVAKFYFYFRIENGVPFVLKPSDLRGRH